MAIIWSAISSPESETSRRLRPAPHVSPTRAHPTSIAPVPARTSSSRPPSPGGNPPAGSPCTRARHLGGPAARRTRTARRCAIGPFPSDPGVGKRGANGAHTPNVPRSGLIKEVPRSPAANFRHSISPPHPVVAHPVVIPQLRLTLVPGASPALGGRGWQQPWPVSPATLTFRLCDFCSEHRRRARRVQDRLSST